MHPYERLQVWIDESRYTVFFGGAGVSTESGVPDFRSTDGLYCQKYPYPPEVMLSHSFYQSRPEEFFRFYREKLLYPDARPNSAHKKLAELERAGKLRAVVTQNIDGLHQAAGSRAVLELHGSVYRNHCQRCHAFFGLEHIQAAAGVPLCDRCGGPVKPDVVLYEEGLDSEVLDRAVAHIRTADLLLVGGTSLAVYPAAGLLDYRRPDGRLVLINRSPTPFDGMADLVITASIGEVLGGVKVR